jgi:hypothetical protein
VVTTEGGHIVQFFSTDNAGNNEEIQTNFFTIDKTAPEASIQWDSQAKDIVVMGVDAQTTVPVVIDSGNQITITDQAGNTTVLIFKQQNRNLALAVDLISISYNGQIAQSPKNALVFAWLFDRSNGLKFLSQSVVSKQKFVVTGLYDGKNTTFIGLDKTGIIYKKFIALKLLVVKTSKGDLEWGY